MKKSKIFIALGLTLLFSCKDLTETNINPNGIEPDAVDPNLVMPYVLSETPKNLVSLSLGITSGIVQHTQLDGWSGEHNTYDFGRRDWKPYYDLLTNNKLMYDRSVELGYEFHQGVGLVMKSMIFGLITDLWGDAPYTSALKGDQITEENIKPTYDSQESIYTAVLADLEEANRILSKGKDQYQGISAGADLIYGGDPVLWRKLANSLQLRFYMRMSSKKPDVAKAGIQKIVGDPEQYPIITDAGEDAALGWPGTSPGTSWPLAVAFDVSESNYSRMKMDSVFVATLLDLEDPRIGVYAEKVQIPLVVDLTEPASTDRIEQRDGRTVRVLGSEKAKNASNTNLDYVGLPTALEAPGAYNMNPNSGTQGAYNPHVSQVNKVFKDSKGELVKARIMSAAEVHFILAEAGQMWGIVDDEAHYNAAIKASFDSWNISSEYEDYMAGSAAYDGTQKQIIEQKWIASWTAATEAWFDFRRTGYPELTGTKFATRIVLPVRFPYGDAEVGQNQVNVTTAVSKLEKTSYVQTDSDNSAWAKPWVLQGTGKPW